VSGFSYLFFEADLLISNDCNARTLSDGLCAGCFLSPFLYTNFVNSGTWFKIPELSPYYPMSRSLNRPTTFILCKSSLPSPTR